MFWRLSEIPSWLLTVDTAEAVIPWDSFDWHDLNMGIITNPE